MSVGSVGKWLSLGALVVALGAVGCGDDDEKGDDAKDSGTDAGGGKPDAGGGGDAGSDGGGGVKVVMCGGNPCSGHTSGPVTFDAGCAVNYLDAEVCGIDSTPVFGADSGFGYLEKNAPGVDSPSCGIFLDNLDLNPDGTRAPADAGTRGNGKQDRYIDLGLATGPVQISTPGCCTPKGYCSGNSNKGESILVPGSAPNPSNGGFGCMQADAFLRVVPEMNRLRCDVDSGMAMFPAPADAGSDAATGDSGTTGDAGSDAGTASDASADGGNS